MFGLGKRANRWGISELKNDLAQLLVSTTPDNIDNALRIILKGVYVHNYTTFKASNRQDLFDSPDSSLTEIEAYLRSRLGSSYDKKVETELDKWKSDYKDYTKASKYQ